MRVIQITPHLPPAYEGVGACAEALAEALAARCGVETRFLVAPVHRPLAAKASPA